MANGGTGAGGGSSAGGSGGTGTGGSSAGASRRNTPQGRSTSSSGILLGGNSGGTGNSSSGIILPGATTPGDPSQIAVDSRGTTLGEVRAQNESNQVPDISARKITGPSSFRGRMLKKWIGQANPKNVLGTFGAIGSLGLNTDLVGTMAGYKLGKTVGQEIEKTGTYGKVTDKIRGQVSQVGEKSYFEKQKKSLAEEYNKLQNKGSYSDSAMEGITKKALEMDIGDVASEFHKYASYVQNAKKSGENLGMEHVIEDIIKGIQEGRTTTNS